MTDHSIHSDDSRRDSLRARIDAAERRNAERTLAEDARAAAAAAVDYTRAHPLTVLGGALVLGLVIGALTRPGRQMMGRVATGAASTVSGAAGAVGGAVGGAASGAASGVRRAAAVPASRMGTMLGDWVVAYGARIVEEALDAARAGQDRVETLGEEAGTRAQRIRHDAAAAAANAADSTRTLAGKTRRKAAEAVREFRGR